jgi:hypothetical protein
MQGQMFADARQMRQSLFVGGKPPQYEGYTDSSGNYFDGGMDGFDIDFGAGQ